MQMVIPIVLWLASVRLVAQPDCLSAFESRLKALCRAHVTVLSAWAGLNAVTGGILAFTAQGEAAYFHAMNLSWGVINAGVAAFLYWHSKKSDLLPKTLLSRLELQHHVEKMLLFNIGLDVAFIMAGVALREHAWAPGVRYTQLWQGFGTSVIVQGAFLLLQDSVFYCFHLRNRRKSLLPSNYP